jgi:hypothetical protein
MAKKEENNPKDGFRTIKPTTRGQFMEGPSEDKNKKIFPHFRMELKHLPEAKKWKVGDDYTIAIKMTQTGLSISRFQNDAEFDIKAIKVIKG